MGLKYSNHALRRMREREIQRPLIRRVNDKPEQVVSDTLTGYQVYVKRLSFKRKRRLMAVTIDRDVVVSDHPIRDKDLINRLNNGRWV